MTESSTMTGSKATSDAPTDILDTPILDLIRYSDVSVRLSNAIVRAGHILPFGTVRAYMQAGSAAKEKFLAIRNLGRRSVDELDHVIRAFVADTPQEVIAALRAPAEHDLAESKELASLRQSLLQLFSDLRFPDALLEGPVPTRLENALRSTPQLACPLSEFLDDVQCVCEKLQRGKNVGRTSTAQLMNITKEFTAAALETSGFSNDAISSARAVIFERRIPTDEALAHLQAIVRTAPKVFTRDKPSTQTASKIIAEAMSDLEARNRDILERRYGLVTGRNETLEEIGLDYKRTRERIRQLEAKSIRAIKLSKVAKTLRLAFEGEIVARLMEATLGSGYIKDGQESEVLQRLPATDRLTMDVLYENWNKFLRKFAKRWHGGWVLAPFEKEGLDELLSELKKRLAATHLPVAFSELVAGMHAGSAAIALELGTDLSIVEGYVLAGRVGPRPRRTIRLHRCLVASGGVIEIGDLVSSYRQAVPSDKHSSVRDATIVMLMAPHLFLGVFDRHWYGLGQAGTPESAVAPADVEQPDAEDEGQVERPDEEGIRVLLRQVLLDQGPLRFVDLRERAARQLKGKSQQSIGPILLTSGDFVRPLPGIYALPEQVPTGPTLLCHPPKFLLAEDQVRYLAEARYAREPFGRYPLWLPEAEYTLCRWAQRSCDPLIFQSLLAVASIDRWPVSSEERDHWSALKMKHGRYALACGPRYPIKQLWPPLDRVLAACVVARENGGLSWIAANRVLKRRLDAHVAPGILALLVAVGALEAPAQWQMFHKASNRLTEIVRSLSSHLHQDGELDWNSPAGEHMLEALGAARPAPKAGWVDQNVVEELIAAAGQRAETALPSAAEADESTSSFDDLMREVAQAQQAETANQTLRAVLGRRN